MEEFDMNKELRDLWQRFRDNGVVLTSVSFEYRRTLRANGDEVYALSFVDTQCSLVDKKAAD